MRRHKRGREVRRRGAVLPAPPFDPIMLSPFAWWRGDLTDTATNFDWLDKSGNGHTLRQATAADKPTIVTPAEIASRSALRFDGTSDFLASTEAASTWTFLHAPGAGGAEVHAVCVPRALNANAYFLTTQQSANPYYLLLSGGASNDAVRLLIANNAGAAAVDVTTVPVMAVASPIRVATALIDDSGGNEYEVFVNGGSLLTAGGITFGSNNPLQTLTLCKRPGLLSNYAQLDYAELVIFNRRLSAGERSSLNAYFVSRYGL
jgi:hypothetical protein